MLQLTPYIFVDIDKTGRPLGLVSRQASINGMVLVIR